jgi:hypothetical protein
MESWTNGTLEYWVWKADMVYSQNNVESTIFDDTRQTIIFCFQSHKLHDYSKKINAMMCSLILFSLYASFHFPRTRYFIIPLFQHSNWGEAPNLSS